MEWSWKTKNSAGVTLVDHRDPADMSLDDIIKSRGAGGDQTFLFGRQRYAGGQRGRGGRGGGGRSRSRSRARSRSRSRSRARSRARSRSWCRSRSRGAQLWISNLDLAVSVADILELFGDLGQLQSAALHYDRQGKSLGTAEVLYSRRSDAIKGNEDCFVFLQVK